MQRWVVLLALRRRPERLEGRDVIISMDDTFGVVDSKIEAYREG